MSEQRAGASPDGELVVEVRKMRKRLTWLFIGYVVFWTVLIFGTVVLYSYHLIP